ncbi:MAG: hypothetical protein QG629_301 [Patescibacteria group bacterium]|nr:carboxypeptidase regulatory-like domain-containing protein [Candidatus Saccharibacteria bacterium]MDQ5963219.1 hypothetical protein [Patescibacteria group bacterium]
MDGKKQGGVTIIELLVALFVIGMIAVSLFTLFHALTNSMVISRRRAVALNLATAQLEYLRSLPYDSLAVQGGDIYATNLLPSTRTDKINGVTYTTTTRISYIDDAYDGCGNYPNLAAKQTYCRNYPAPTSAPATDQNPADYKVAHVKTTDRNGRRLANVDTQITARVAESASATGALFVTVIDESGAPVSGASVAVTNTTIVPQANLSDSTDGNGVAIFYNLPPDSGNDYVVSATKPGFSSLQTIGVSGSLQPVYQSQKILSQQPSSVTLRIAPMTSNSLLTETVDTAGSPIAGVKVYAKGGYKKYTDTNDSAYYFDNLTPSDTRPTTDAQGLAAFSNLVPVGGYIFCGDTGASSCGGYYLAAAVPYSGVNSLLPIAVPTSPTGSPAPAPYSHNGTNYIQKVRLIMTTNASFPRVFTMSPYEIGLASTPNISAVSLTLKGTNLSGASLALTKGAASYNGTACTSDATQIKCMFDLTGATVGTMQLTVSNGSGSLTLPTTPLGGFNVAP